MKTKSGTIAVAALAVALTACGDDVTKVTNVTQETTGAKSVSSLADAEECGAPETGSLVFNHEDGKLYVCDGGGWIVLNGDNGSSEAASSPTFSSAAVSSSSVNHAANPCVGDKFTDGRDGTVYACVTIGTQTWMAENLNFGVRVDVSKIQTGASADSAQKYCMENSAQNCTTYGGLYQWHTAMALPASYANTYAVEEIDRVHRGICPEGWHIPTELEWDGLAGAIGGASNGTKLKSTAGWEGGYNGTNATGFNAMPAGYWAGGFGGLGAEALFWTATEDSTAYASFISLNWSGNLNTASIWPKSRSASIRCVKD
ncbi:MAG: hypothetical protein J6V65_05420 [Fibrobacterales bacterium]|nr:hypothetical protein [Fibrobacterales bacterium]